jgi:hypothetical protein
MLDVVSNRLRSRGAVSWVRAMLLVCGPFLLLFFNFLLRFFHRA